MSEVRAVSSIEDANVGAGRRRILDEAARLFVAHGYTATTLRQIAAATGIKAGSVYYHYASKDDLFEASWTGASR